MVHTESIPDSVSTYTPNLNSWDLHADTSTPLNYQDHAHEFHVDALRAQHEYRALWRASGLDQQHQYYQMKNNINPIQSHLLGMS